MAQQIDLGVVVAWVSGRTATLSGSEKLSDYTTVDVDLEIQVAKRILLRGEVSNLFNQNVVIWPGHPEFGRVIALGLHGTW